MSRDRLHRLFEFLATAGSERLFESRADRRRAKARRELFAALAADIDPDVPDQIVRTR